MNHSTGAQWSQGSKGTHYYEPEVLTWPKTNTIIKEIHYVPVYIPITSPLYRYYDGPYWDGYYKIIC